ncbi:MAG: carboxypeptidase regulatory-like domain-containing protein [Acidobacteriota bacterium]|nr:carboxypeptidase regulatory-like domain-containing protein [Blastocatellia bacterium]MDW8239408.1 carboxypeptidase regulatory-like domain-containing protein [Acidobacteriota bacterium]
MKLKSLMLIGLLLMPSLAADRTAGTVVSELSGVVTDPQGAVVAQATVTLINQQTGAAQTSLCDGKGAYAFTGLRPGTYGLRAWAPGMDSGGQQVVQLREGQKLTVDIKLQIARLIEQIDVGGKPPGDPIFTQLREIGFSDNSMVASNVELKRDVGRFRFDEGTFYFFNPVMERVTGAVFVGRGRFTMRPSTQTDRNFLRHLLQDAEDPTQINEPFEQLILYFTDATFDELKTKLTPASRPAPESVKDDFKNHQRELRRQLRATIELRILSDLYTPTRKDKGFFTAFIKGQKLKKLIYVVDPLGAVPNLPSPEEVALISYDRNTQGIWSLCHFEDDYKRGTASSNENHLEYDITHVRIDSLIERNEQLTASAQVTFVPRMPGLRLIQMALFPRLRVSRVLDDNGATLPFIHVEHEEGGAFGVVYPEALTQRAYTLTIEYRGPEAVQDSGGGNYILNPACRDTWYPNNWQTTFGDRATFDMTFRIPSNLQMVATGKKVREWKDGKYACSQWISEFPLAVAGFNYGDFRVLERQDQGFTISVFTNKDEPNELKEIRQIYEQMEKEEDIGKEMPVGNLSTAGLANSSLVEALNSIRIFNQYFGVNPYGRIVMSQQPAAFFGQSWPMLVYMPYIAFLDATQRKVLGMGATVTKFTDVVGPHEVAHQWWGHLVSWKTYHDQWLSEGFAEFSASLYLQYAFHKDPQRRQERFLKFWQEEHNYITKKYPLGLNNVSMRPNDVAPIWLGSRMDTARTAGAYAFLVYRKGAFILHMLRMMMMDTRAPAGRQDDRFIAMMRDFVQSHLHQAASTEDFKRIVEKHMTPDMDQAGNGRMDWFFNQWVYGTDLPHYKLQYNVDAGAGGKPVLKIKIEQSNVSPDFVMPLPIYVEFGKGRTMRLTGRITGNSSTSAEIPMPEKPTGVKLCANYDVLCTIEEVKGKINP